jgi:pseudouridine synthase
MTGQNEKQRRSRRTEDDRPLKGPRWPAPQRRSSPPRPSREEPMEEQALPDVEPVRLQKFLSMAGVTSRRAAETLIEERRITVNGQVVDRMGVLIRPGVDEVIVDGRAVSFDFDRRLEVYAYYKPRGILVTASDPEGRPTIYDQLADQMGGLPPGTIPVGRLDRNSEGLLLLTNDGELAHRLMHPSYEVLKEYEVVVDGEFPESGLEKLQNGVDIGDGPDRETAPCEAEILSVEEDRTRLRVVLQEGRKRQIRRMMEALGYEVRRLVRVREGSITLRGVRLGTVRRLAPMEVRQLRAEVGLEGFRSRDSRGGGAMAPRSSGGPRSASSSSARSAPGSSPREAPRSDSRGTPRFGSRPESEERGGGYPRRSGRPPGKSGSRPASRFSDRSADRSADRPSDPVGNRSGSRPSNRPAGRPSNRLTDRPGTRSGPRTPPSSNDSQVPRRHGSFSPRPSRSFDPSAEVSPKKSPKNPRRPRS